MKTYVMTRGTARQFDYRWFPDAPERWWNTYEEYNSDEDASLLVVRDSSGFRAFISGIPSARTDAVRTAIRYTLDFDSAGGEVPAHVLAILLLWLTDRDHLGRLLDDVWDDETVDGWYTGVGVAAPDRLTDLSWPVEPGTAVESKPFAGYGGLDNDQSRVAAASQLRAIAGGEPGSLLVLNAIDLSPDTARLASGLPAQPVLILGQDSEEPPKRTPTKPAPARPTLGKAPEPSPNPRKVLIIVGAGLGLVLLIIAWRALQQKG